MKTSKLLKAIHVLPLAASAYFIAIYLIIAILRINYPFELEWMESGMVDHVRRVLAWKNVYVRPSIEFVPYLYTPLYYYVSAGLSLVLGVSFLPLRLVSFISSAGCFILIFYTVKKETGSSFAGIISAGVFAATFRLSGAWLDIGRCDSLFVFLTLLAIFLLRYYESPKAYIIAGLFAALAFFTKQTALVVLLPLSFLLLLTRRLFSLYFIAVAAFIILAGILVENYVSSGWFNYYVFTLPSYHNISIDLNAIVKFLITDIWQKLPIVCLLAVFWFAMLFRGGVSNGWFYIMAVTGMLAGACVSRNNWGQYDNVLIPAYVAVAILAGLAFKPVTDLPAKAAVVGKAAFSVIITVQLLMLLYNPYAQVPGKKDIDAGNRLIAKISEVKGDVFIPYHSYLAAMAGKKTYAHHMGIFDIIRNGGPEKTELIEEIDAAISGKKFSALVLDTNFYDPLIPYNAYKEEKLDIYDDENSFMPVTGFRTRPTMILRPQFLNR